MHVKSVEVWIDPKGLGFCTVIQENDGLEIRVYEHSKDNNSIDGDLTFEFGPGSESMKVPDGYEKRFQYGVRDGIYPLIVQDD